MIKYIIYTQNNCEYCDKAKKRLDKEKAHVEERLLDTTEKIKRCLYGIRYTRTRNF